MQNTKSYHFPILSFFLADKLSLLLVLKVLMSSSKYISSTLNLVDN